MKKYYYVWDFSKKAIVYGDGTGWGSITRDEHEVANYISREVIGDTPEEAMSKMLVYAEKQIKLADERAAAAFKDANRTKAHYAQVIREMTSMK